MNPAESRNIGFNEENKVILQSYLEKRLDFSDKDVETIKSYLFKREKKSRNKLKTQKSFNVVYDITQYCNLNCLHCCINGKLSKDLEKVQLELSFEDISQIIDRIKKYIKEENYENYFLMFGGGEPFLRPDFPDILQYASKVLGRMNVGFNTNGTTASLDDIKSVCHKVSAIEISIDGFEANHNRWRDPHHLSQFTSPFKTTYKLAKQIALESDLAGLLEVSAIATKDNIEQLPEFMKFLSENNINSASIHRAMPVGRMELMRDKVPNPYEYAHLLLGISNLCNDYPAFDVHIHHSLESIYSAILLGNDIHRSEGLMGSIRHSIGFDWLGNAFFDPWCVVPPYNKLVAGNILKKDLREIIENSKSPIHIANNLVKKNVRCKQCRFPCSGGMRLNALADYIGKLAKIKEEISVAHLITGLSQLDPACPLNGDEISSSNKELAIRQQL